ncbi:ABC transporter ATP-binding protein [Microvirga alba]|uniref:ABC transporter ATP-binding protein n=1 Tax=Microvirga alba TaxID=2791025 RepID=A0A931FNX5_9HYPH|nr:ABC transporter ATP-binding protein [Microvirga alba]MBF9232822.1 ABC transporter ATP-binding protein [Microvirga alba]
MPETSPILDVDGLTTVLTGSKTTILENVSFSLRAGEVLGVVGESGSGKSMLALAMMGLLPKAIRTASGRISLDGEDLIRLPADQWREKRGRDLAMIFQEPMTALNPVMRVGAQVEEVLRRRRGLSSSQARKVAIDLFHQVEIPSAEARLKSYPHEMSGGMRQRVMIAMAFAADARLLIADEPTTALDVTVQAQILDLLRKLQKERGLALLFITHDLGVIADIADTVLVLYAGRVAEVAPVRQIFDDPQHPYTKALIASIPKIEGPRDRLVTIEGNVPTVGTMPRGCRYAPRCPYRRDICETEAPPLRPVTQGQKVACLQPFGFPQLQEEAFL